MYQEKLIIIICIWELLYLFASIGKQLTDYELTILTQ